MFSRAVNEGIQIVGKNEKVAFTITTTPWGSSPSSVSVKLYDTTDGTPWTDVTSTKLSGVATVTGDIITLPLIQSVEEDHTYRCDVQFVCSGNTLECYFEVLGTR